MEAKKEHGMLFADRLMPPLLSGRKVQTRRPPRYQPKEIGGGVWEMKLGRSRSTTSQRRRMVYDGDTGALKEDEHYILPLEEWLLEFCPYRVGDYIWARETFRLGHVIGDTKKPIIAVYCDTEGRMGDEDTMHPESPDGSRGWALQWKKTPSIHMPKWACRCWLKITDVRVQRIQEISYDDVLAEGTEIPVTPDGSLISILSGKNPPCDFWPVKTYDELKARPDFMEQWYRSHFAASWSSIYPGTWEENIWVWALTFERTETP